MSEKSLRILLLAEGDAETPNSWSGSSMSVVQHLRALGHTVRCADVDLSGPGRYLAALLTAWPTRQRWAVRFHLGGIPFALRSRLAGRHLARHWRETDLILQIGAPCAWPAGNPVPYVLYCDSNILFSSSSSRGRALSDANFLSSRELAGVRKREQTVYRGAAAILTMSEALRRCFIEGFGIPAERVHTVHAGANLDVSRIPARTPDKPPHAPPTILFVGRAFERKGGPLLLRAFERVRRVMPEARLMIIGPTQDPGPAPGVDFVGLLDKTRESDRERLNRAYADATVFCLPTEFEPFGIAFVEAMFWGLPCIGPDAWAVPEIIAEGETGVLFQPGNEESLAAAILALLQDRHRATALGRAGRERALAGFTWDATAQRIDRVLSKVIQRS